MRSLTVDRARAVEMLLLAGDLAVHRGAVPLHRGRRPLALEHAGAGTRLLARRSAHLGVGVKVILTPPPLYTVYGESRMKIHQ